MFKRILLSGAAFVSTVALHSAYAADLPSHKSPPAEVAPPPIFLWTGLHAGFNRGYGGGVFDANASFGLASTQTSNVASGFLVGGQVGYDFQFANNFVLGVETDFQWTNIKASHQATNFASIGLAGFTYADIHNGLDWFGTGRLRLGYSFGRLLPYVTGGVAYGQVNAFGAQFAGGALFLGSATDTKVGWTVGGGAEYALTDNLSAKVEYLFMRLPGVGGPAIGLAPPPFPPLLGSFSTGSLDAHLVRFGANWKFGGFGGAPAGGLLDFLTAAPTVDWSGFYVGVNGGYGGGVTDAVVTLASPVLATTTQTTNHAGGFLAGGQIGYNLHYSNHVVLGVESDIQWSGVKAWHQATTWPGFIFTDTQNALEWFGTTRVRAGWAMGSALPYVTGGVAKGDVSARGTQVSGGLFLGSASQTQIGWTVGAGAEYALTNNLSLKAEYLYMDFRGVRGAAAGVALPPFPPFAGDFSTGDFGVHVTRAGLNWRFGSVGAPVTAKY